MSLLQCSVTDRLGLTGIKYMQKCKGFMSSKDLEMESASICVRGLDEEKEHLICDIGIFRDVPRSSKLLLHMLDEDIVREFSMPYPILRAETAVICY